MKTTDVARIPFLPTDRTFEAIHSPHDSWQYPFAVGDKIMRIEERFDKDRDRPAPWPHQRHDRHTCFRKIPQQKH